mgnify:CR=1 FL=1
MASEEEGELEDGELAAALEFFAAVLPLLKPRVFELEPSNERPILVWSDGAAEPSAVDTSETSGPM